MRTFRQHPAAAPIACIFAIGGLAGTIMVLSNVATGNTQSRVNGVLTNDPGAYLVGLIPVGMCLIVGIYLLCNHFFRRVEVDDHAIRIYDTWNQLRFQSPWKEIDRLSSQKPRPGKPREPWMLFSGPARGEVYENLYGYPEMMQVIALAIPEEALPPSSRTGGAEPFEVRSLTHKGGSDMEGYGAVMSFLWFGVGLFMMVIPFFVTLGENSMPPLLFSACVGLFMGSTVPGFMQMWRAAWRRTSSVGPEGLEVDLSGVRSRIGWEEIIFAEVRAYQPYKNQATVIRELVVASRTNSLAIHADETIFKEAVKAVFRLAPPSAILVPEAIVLLAEAE